MPRKHIEVSAQAGDSMRCHLEAIVKAKGTDFSVSEMTRQYLSLVAIREQAVISGTCPPKQGLPGG